jgi:hypothetical protein
MTDTGPISHPLLRDLFEHLDRSSMSGYKCDHTFALTRRFLTDRALPVEEILLWLSREGAGCDCEVMFNVAPEWEEVVGYEPPDDDE